MIFFVEKKNERSFGIAKATHIFSTKNIANANASHIFSTKNIGNAKASLIFSTKNFGEFQILTLEILMKE